LALALVAAILCFKQEVIRSDAKEITQNTSYRTKSQQLKRTSGTEESSFMDRVTEGLLSEFTAQFGINRLPEEDRFVQFAAWLTVRRHYSDTTFNPVDLVTENGGDTGIDAIAVVVNNNLITDVDTIGDLLEVNGYLDVTFVFVQAERSAHFDSGKIAKFAFGVTDFFGEGKLPRNDQIKQYAEIMSAIFDQSSKFPSNPECYLYYVTTGKWVDDRVLSARIEAVESDLRATEMFSKVQFIPIGADQLRSLYRQSKNSVRREFTFERKVVVPEVSGVTAAYLGFLSAKDLLRLVCDDAGEIIKGLFYENVRDYLGLNAINNEMLETLSSHGSDRFVLMNNGVTMITRMLKTTGDRFTIEDFQVVNGCQTTHVLHNAVELSDAIRVPFRLIHTQDETVIEAIIRATNRQTEVRDDQFFAMKDFAKKLEVHFKTYPVESRVYYERRPHQYDSLDIEKTRIITHQNLVRATGAMFLGEPHITTRNFRQLAGKVGKDMFVDTDKPEPYFVAAYTLYRLEQMFRGKKLDARFKAARYQILLVARFLIDAKPFPSTNSNEMTRRCNAMIEILRDDGQVEALFLKAAAMIDEIGGSWNRDSVRTEPITKAITDRLRQRAA
jgi:hypothetical protein